eukprot:gene29318-8469_t
MSYGPCKLCNTRYNPCAVAIYNPNGNDATKCPAFEEGDTYHSDGYYGLVWPDPPEGTLTWGCCGNKDKESAGCKTRTTEKLVVCKHDDPRYYHYHLANLQETTLYNKAVATRRAIRENEVAPKLPASAYILFCVDTRVQLAQEQPELGAIEVMKELGDKWKAAGDEARKPTPAAAAVTTTNNNELSDVSDDDDNDDAT